MLQGNTWNTDNGKKLLVASHNRSSNKSSLSDLEMLVRNRLQIFLQVISEFK